MYDVHCFINTYRKSEKKLYDEKDYFHRSRLIFISDLELPEHEELIIGRWG